jgi:hypothetical protein
VNRHAVNCWCEEARTINVPDIVGLRESSNERRAPELIRNYRTPFLDLGVLYAGGPNLSPKLYEGEKGAEIFKIGITTPSGWKRDLPIENGEILVDPDDDRNLDNIILRQLHVVFLKFHNKAVEQLSINPAFLRGITALTSGTIFERAQRIVRWHYQWLVRHDFVPRILHPSTWNRGSRFTRQSRRPFRIPIEFSLAAYRFGHSMVRKAYALNCRRRRVELPELLALGGTRAQLSEDSLIEWGRFFDGLPTSGPVASSSFIDTSITAPPHSLPTATLRLLNPNDQAPEPVSLPVRTLLRGARARLPSANKSLIHY